MTQTAAPLTFEVTRRTDPRPDAEREAVLANPGFGTTFTDHMLTATWRRGQGWQDGKVTAYGPFSLMPSAAVLHYAQEIFEGMKAYRHEDGSIWTFRPEANAQRMIRSARRMALPELLRGGLRRLAAGLRRGRPGVGAGLRDRGDQPLPAALHVRLRGLPRGAAGRRGHLLGDRLTCRRLLQRRHQAGEHLAVPALRAGGRGRHRRGQDAVATTPRAWPASWRASRTAATRPCSSTPRRTPTSRSWAA